MDDNNCRSQIQCGDDWNENDETVLGRCGSSTTHSQTNSAVPTSASFHAHPTNEKILVAPLRTQQIEYERVA